MKILRTDRQQIILILGDAVTLFLVTIAGFASHGELGTTGLRLFSTFIPLSIAWFLISPHLGVFEIKRIHELKQIWRPFWAMILAAPLAGWIRGLWLGTAVLPIFVVILGGISALAILIWRILFLLASERTWLFNG
jgi:hypothetical protein